MDHDRVLVFRREFERQPTEKLFNTYTRDYRPWCDEAYEAIRLILHERGREVPARTVHQNRIALPAPWSFLFGLLGVLTGCIIGYLLRPSAPLVGQLEFKTVITRGSMLQGLDRLLVSVAETSFNYLMVGLIVGGTIGAIAGYVLQTTQQGSTRELAGATGVTADIDRGDITDRIRKLADLRSERILTEDEFQSKKAELLRHL